MANTIAKEALNTPQLGIRVMPIPLERLHAGVGTDAAWGNAREFGQYLEDSKIDWWEEQPDRWIRHHQVPRFTGFHPAAAPDGPDLHDLLPDRRDLFFPPSFSRADSPGARSHAVGEPGSVRAGEKRPSPSHRPQGQGGRRLEVGGVSGDSARSWLRGGGCGRRCAGGTVRLNDTKNILQDEWASSSSITSLAPSPWTGTTTFKKQPQQQCLEAKLIHGGYEQLLKLYSQGGEITFFYDRDLPESQSLQNVTLAPVIRTLDAVRGRKIGWLVRGGFDVRFCESSICSRFRFTDAYSILGHTRERKDVHGGELRVPHGRPATSELMRVAVSHLRAEAERWENVRECLRMAASTIPLVERTAPTRLAAALMVAETPGAPLDGQDVRCTVSTHEGWSIWWHNRRSMPKRWRAPWIHWLRSVRIYAKRVWRDCWGG